ncbi:porin [Candidatus Pelagibacter sp.]|nr:porin [Candidatus Pelagibacter sp.]
MFNINIKTKGVINMNNLKKVGLTALAGSLVAGSVSAADLSATGTASMSYSGGDDKAVSGNGWSMSDSFTLSASGDVNDIGVTLSFEVEGSENNATNQLDSHSISFDFGDAGTLTFAGHGGSSALGAVDDVMPTANEEPWDVLTGAETNVVGGGGGNENFLYNYSHDSGLNFAASYTNAADAVTDVSYHDIGVSYTGIDGLTVGYAQGDVEYTTGTKQEQHTMYATYAMGGFTVGLQTSENDQAGSTNDRESTGMGISYQVNDDLAVSYGTHQIEFNSGQDQDTSAVSASYTMGSLSISGSMHSGDNIGNTDGNNREAYELNLVFNF